MKTVKFFLTLLIICLCTLTSKSQLSTGDFTITYQETGSGANRNFYMSVPNDYDSTKSYPVLYAWHGSGMTGSNMRSSMKAINTNTGIGGIICCPDINGMTTADQLNEMINNSTQYYEQYNVDHGREIITGFSLGGYYSFQIGLLNPEDFAGIIGFSPAIGLAQFNSTMWDNISKIRMGTILGTLDFNWSAVNALMVEIQNKGGNLLYLIKENVTHSDNVYFNSQAFIDDYKYCYNYVTGNTSIENNPADELISLNVYPNPFTDGITVAVSSEKECFLKIRIFDLYGKEVYSFNTELEALSMNKEIDLDMLGSGSYIVSVALGDKVYYQKINKID
ncbi:T9SS type A sorting domain-containing protein [Bacteroidota bacterium]